MFIFFSFFNLKFPFKASSHIFIFSNVCLGKRKQGSWDTLYFLCFSCTMSFLFINKYNILDSFWTLLCREDTPDHCLLFCLLFGHSGTSTTSRTHVHMEHMLDVHMPQDTNDKYQLGKDPLDGSFDFLVVLCFFWIAPLPPVHPFHDHGFLDLCMAIATLNEQDKIARLFQSHWVGHFVVKCYFSQSVATKKSHHSIKKRYMPTYCSWVNRFERCKYFPKK